MEEKKFCKFCGEEIDKNSIICPKCGRQLESVKEEINSPVTTVTQSPLSEEKNQSKISKKAKIIISIVVALIILGLVFGGNNDEQDKENTTTNEANQNQSSTETSYSFNETFEFDNLEITIGSSYIITKVNNEYSDYHQKDVVKLPITIKNLKNETHSLNMFYYNIFGSTGTEVESTWIYFDDSIENAGELRSGASYTKYLYFLYDGDGTYAIEFDDIWNKKTVEIEIKK